ncbi:fatty acid desaturase family protein [Leifsonia shinshuensis]|uniref:Acyl-CoA desaturase n=1 Tax=Leifsonia shinshuensis TaxID=150026 RepID=A0A7G6YBF0_9MICO|nr:acyl-CoA desaturase [Leifsonia shinshuensis]QNE35815.1 acyl-CoA desaturase [Leifsonia shinshuensis]
MTASTLGPVLKTRPRTETRAPVTSTYNELLGRVRGEGLLERRRGFYIAMFSALTVGLLGAAAGFVLLGDSWFQLLIAAALGLIFTQFAFLGHEASHRQVFASGPTNDRAGRLIATWLVGMSYQWWMTKHTRHHANPNTEGKDPDIAFDTISFTVEDASRQRGLLAAITRRQGYLFFPLLLLEGVNLHVTSIRSLLARGPVERRRTELVAIGLRLSIYLTILFLMLPVGMAFAFLGVQLAVFGVYMGASFAPNHKGMPLLPAGSRVDLTGRVGVFEPREYSLSGLPVGGVVRPRAASVRADADDGEWAQSEDAGEHRGRDLSGELLGCGQAQLPRLDVECSAQPVR